MIFSNINDERDYVDLVRCFECKNNQFMYIDGKNRLYCPLNKRYVDFQDFCSFGKTSDGEVMDN